MANVNAIPPEYGSVTASITSKDTAKAIEYYKKALGAIERVRMQGPDGMIMHAEIQIGNSIIMMNDEVMGCRSAETLGGSPINFYVYVEDVDRAFQQATTAGCKETMPVADMFWGDRTGAVLDPFGIRWSLATHTKDLTPEEIQKGQEEFMKLMAGAK